MKITPAYKHSKLGTFMFNVCAKFTEIICKHRWLYYLLACTWGFIMTFIGIIITIVLLPFTKPTKYNWIYCMKIGPDYWGGFDCGLMFIRDQKSSCYLDAHEFGHTFQNCLLGPLMPFLVTIPSAIRWWIRALNPKKQWPDYDAVWFEDSASKCGEWADQYLKK